MSTGADQTVEGHRRLHVWQRGGEVYVHACNEKLGYSWDGKPELLLTRLIPQVGAKGTFQFNARSDQFDMKLLRLLQVKIPCNMPHGEPGHL